MNIIFKTIDKHFGSNLVFYNNLTLKLVRDSGEFFGEILFVGLVTLLPIFKENNFRKLSYVFVLKSEFWYFLLRKSSENKLKFMGKNFNNFTKELFFIFFTWFMKSPSNNRE